MRRRGPAFLLPAALMLSASFLFAGPLARPAHALIHLSMTGGISFGSGEGTATVRGSSPFFGFELTSGLAGLVHLGGFIDHNLQTYLGGATGPLQFFGSVIRFTPKPGAGLFLDGKLGLARSSVLGVGSDFSLGMGAGAGYRFKASPAAAIGPRFGIRSLPYEYGRYSASRVMTDFSFILTIGF